MATVYRVNPNQFETGQLHFATEHEAELFRQDTYGIYHKAKIEALWADVNAKYEGERLTFISRNGTEQLIGGRV